MADSVLDRSPWYQIKSAQRYELQQLVRRFIIQLHYGCKNSKCESTYCFSFRKTRANPPARRPSLLNARVLAWSLATSSNPYSKLCPNEPVILPEQLELSPDLLRAFLFNDDSKLKVHPVPVVYSEFFGQGMQRDAEPLTLRIPNNDKAIEDFWRSSLPSHKGSQVDRKSLFQKLYSTKAFRSFEWAGTSHEGGVMRWFLAPYTDFYIRTPLIRFNMEISSSVRENDLEEFYIGNRGTNSTSNEFNAIDQGGIRKWFGERDIQATNMTGLSKHAQGVDQIIVWTLSPSSVEGTEPSADREVPVVRVQHQTLHANNFTLNNVHGLVESFEDLVDLKEEIVRISAGRVQTTLTDEEYEVALSVFESVFHAFGTTYGLCRLLRSEISEKGAYPEYTAREFCSVFYDLEWYPGINRRSWGILNMLSHAIDALFIPPPDWKTSSPGKKAGDTLAYVRTEDAAHMLFICAVALSGALDNKRLSPEVREQISRTVTHRYRYPFEEDTVSWLNPTPGFLRTPSTLERKLIINIHDHFMEPSIINLATKVVRVFAARRAFEEDASPTGLKGKFELMDKFLDKFKWTRTLNQADGCWYARLDFIDFLITVATAQWKGETRLNRWEPAGAAIEILSDVLEGSNWTGSQNVAFIEDRLPAFEHDWILKYSEDTSNDPNYVYLLQFPILFSMSTRTSHFRAINYCRMCAAYRQAGYVESLGERLYPTPDKDKNRYLKYRLEKATSRYLMLNVKRGKYLESALDSLWGREKRELMRPLKVRMGMDTFDPADDESQIYTETGIDQGGVSQEFFRLVFREAFDPDVGLFQTTDEEANRVWFSPMSMEPLSTYQLIGLLVGLGIYNGITLPVSFPTTLYSYIKRGARSTKRDEVANDWPSLYNNLEEICLPSTTVEDLDLDWTYTFSANGQTHSLDMKESTLRNGELQMIPTTDSTEPVTTQNRTAYVQRYLDLLLYETIAPQLDAFVQGFKTVLDPRTLSVLTVTDLQSLTEGHTTIDMHAFEAHVRYEEPYHHNHTIIQWFWKIVHAYAPELQKSLLKFVTASDRVPAGGIEMVNFRIVRAGGSTENLPTSSTCFGKLALPEYESEEKLGRKLGIALENCIGFGAA